MTIARASSAEPSGSPPFVAHPLMRGSFLQTLAPSLFPPSEDAPFARATSVLRCALEDGDTLALLENLPVSGSRRRMGFLLVGGLGSHARVPNLERLARKLVARGFPVWRLNHRGTGEGEGLARGIYHGARAEDLDAAVGHVLASAVGPDALVLVGYSLSGNMALRYAGEWGSRLPPRLAGVIAASPVLDLAANAPLIPKAALGFYDWNFLRELRRTVRLRHAAYTDLGEAPLPRRLDLHEFDALYTAPQAGFASREDYYAKASSLPWLGKIGIRAHVIRSDDDPFALKDPRELPGGIGQTRTTRGGHHGFFASEATELGDRFWLDAEIARVAEEWAGEGDR